MFGDTLKLKNDVQAEIAPMAGFKLGTISLSKGELVKQFHSFSGDERISVKAKGKIVFISANDLELEKVGFRNSSGGQSIDNEEDAATYNEWLANN